MLYIIYVSKILHIIDLIDNLRTDIHASSRHDTGYKIQIVYIGDITLAFTMGGAPLEAEGIPNFPRLEFRGQSFTRTHICRLSFESVFQLERLFAALIMN